MTNHRNPTPKIATSIVALVDEGQWPEVAGRSLGLRDGIVTDWLAAGKEEYMTSRKTEEDPRSYRRKLYEKVTEAEARYEIKMVDLMNERVRDTKYFQGCLAILARRFPERWGERRGGDGPATSYEEMLRQWERERQPSQQQPA